MTTSGLTKLYKDGLPTLDGEAPKPGDVAVHLIALKRWAIQQSIGAYVQGPLPEPVDLTMKREGLRFVMASLSSARLRNGLSDSIPGLDNAPQALKHIEEKWLSGMNMSDVLMDRMESMVFQKGESLMAFTSEFNMIAANIHPTIPSIRACELYAARLPNEFEAFCQQADKSPGPESEVEDREEGRGRVVHVKSLIKYTEEVVRLVQKYEARQTARERHQPAVYNPDALRTHAYQQAPNRARIPPSFPDDELEADDSLELADMLDALATFARGRGRGNPPPRRDYQGGSNRFFGGNNRSESVRENPRTPQPNHSPPDTPSPYQAPPLRCFNCAKEGHLAANCPDPPQTCDHPICVARKSTRHHALCCPHKHPDKLTNPKVRERAEIDLRIYNAGLESAAQQHRAHSNGDRDKQLATQRRPAHATTLDPDLESLHFNYECDEVDSEYGLVTTCTQLEVPNLAEMITPLAAEDDHWLGRLLYSYTSEFICKNTNACLRVCPEMAYLHCW